MNIRNNKTTLVCIYIGLIGTIAFVLMLWITPYGSGASDDSVTYIGSARSLLAGNGYSMNGEPVVHWPPLYPLFLAAAGLFDNDLIQASRFVNAIVFGINAGLVALMVYVATKRNFLSSVCAVLFFLSSAPLLRVHAYAWSEPLFITFSLACIMFLSMYLLQPSSFLLIQSSLSMGLALLTRYIGLAFLPAALVILFFAGVNQRPSQRFRNMLIWLVIACAPLGILLTRNVFVAGSATSRGFILQPASVYRYGRDFVSVLTSFLIPVAFPAGVRLLILGPIAILVVVLLVILFKHHPVTADWSRTETAMAVTCFLFIISFVAILFISISFFDPGTPVDGRILSPILVILIVGMFSAIWTMAQILKAPFVWWGFLFLMILSISIKIPNAIQYGSTIQKEGLGYTAPKWQKSATVAFVRTFPNSIRVYTNRPEAISLLTEKQALTMPQKAKYHKQIASMCSDIENGALLVQIIPITSSWDLPPAVKSTCQLTVLGRFADGTVYGGK